MAYQSIPKSPSLAGGVQGYPGVPQAKFSREEDEFVRQVQAAIQGMSPEDANAYIDRAQQVYAQQFQQPEPVQAPPEGGDFGTGFSAGLKSLKGTGYGALGYLGAVSEDVFGVGEDLRDWGIEGYQREMGEIGQMQRPEYEWENVQTPGQLADFVQYWSGYGAANLLGGLGTGQALKLGTKLGVKGLVKEATEEQLKKAGQRGFVAGVGTQAVGQEIGATYGEAVERALGEGKSVEDVDLGRVGIFGAAAGGLEFGTDLLTLGLLKAAPTNPFVKALADSTTATRSRLANAAIGGTTVGTLEGLTEMGQTGLEQIGSGLSAEEATFTDPTSFFAGAIGGGQVGAARGLVAKPRPQLLAEEEMARRQQQEDQYRQAQQAIATAEQARLEKEEAQRVEAQQKVEEQAALDTNRERRQYYPTFVSFEDFMKGRQQARLEEMNDETTDLGAAFVDWQDQNGVYESSDKTKKAFLKQALDKKQDAVDAKTEYEALFDQHIAAMKTREARAPEEQAVFEQQGQQLLEARQAATTEEELAAIEQQAAQVFNIAEWDYLKRQSDLQLKETKSQGKAAVDAVKEAQKEAKQTAKDRSVARANELLGENWEEIYPELSALSGEAKNFWSRGAGKGSRFDMMLDQIAAEVNVKSAEDVLGQVDLKGNQKRLLDFLLEKAKQGQLLDFMNRPETVEGKKAVTDGTDETGNFSPIAIAEEFKIVDRNGKEVPASKAARDYIKKDLTRVVATLKQNRGLANALAAIQGKRRFVEGEEATSATEQAAMAEESMQTPSIMEATDEEAQKGEIEIGDQDRDVGVSIVRSPGDYASQETTGGKKVNVEELRRVGGTSVEKATAQKWLDANADLDLDPNTVSREEVDPVAVKRVQEANARLEQSDKKRLAVAEKSGEMGKATEAWAGYRADIPFDSLSNRDKVEWIESVSEFEQTGDEALLSEDANEIAVRYEETTGEQGRATEAEAVAEGEVEAPARGAERGAGAVEGTAAETEAELPEGVTRFSIAGGEELEAMLNPKVIYRAQGKSGRTWYPGGQFWTNLLEVGKKYLRGDKGKTLLKSQQIPKNPFVIDRVAAMSEAERKAMLDDFNAWLEKNYPEHVGNLEKDGPYLNEVLINGEADFPFPKPADIDYLRSKGYDSVFFSREGVGETAAEEQSWFVFGDPIYSTKYSLTGEEKIRAAVGKAARVRLEKVLESISGEATNIKVKIYDTQTDAIAGRINNEFKTPLIDGAKAFVEGTPGKSQMQVFFIAENIAPGTEMGVFLHEVGVHMGMESILNEKQLGSIVDKIQEWAVAPEGKIEGQIARKVLLRIENARMVMEANGLPFDQAAQNAEWVAYFVEEAINAGINPATVEKNTSLSFAFRKFIRDLYTAFKRALRKLNMNPDSLTGRDIVDMAYGAARMEMNGIYHGTAAVFRQFDHKFMSSGEGAQAYGWGTYLAERFGIGRQYWLDDVARKERNFNRGVVLTPEKELSEFQQKVMKKLQRKDGTYPLRWNLEVQEQAIKNLARREIPRYGDEAAKAKYDQLQKEYEELLALKTAFDEKQAPVEGSLFRTDTTVAKDELLDWDKPVKNQKKVVEAFNKMPEAVQDMLLEDANVDDINDTNLTGRNFYFGLANLQLKDYVIEEFLSQEQYDLASMSGKSPVMAKAMASMYLDNLGVKGITFLDAASRSGRQGPTLQELNLPWLDPDKTYYVDSAKRGRVEAKINPLMPLRTTASTVMIPMVFEGASPQVGISPYQRSVSQYDIMRSTDKTDETLEFTDEQLKQLRSAVENFYLNNKKTSNRVIFNEDNVIIVGRQPGARMAPGEFRYSISEDTVAANYGQTAADVYNTGSNLLKKAAGSLKFLHQFIRDVRNDMPAAQAWHRAVLSMEMTRNEIRQSVESIAVRSQNLADDRLMAVNQFIKDSTETQQWGYDPEFARLKDVKIDAGMRSRFNSLSGEEQQLVKDVFQHGENMLQRMRENAKAMGVDDKFFKIGQLQGPYAPLKRFGKYVAEFKSAELVDAQNRYAAASREENKEEMKSIQKEIDALRLNENNYLFKTFDTYGAAKKFVRLNKEGYDYAQASEKRLEAQNMQSADYRTYQKVLSALNADENSAMDAQSKRMFQDMVKDMYFNSLDEANARQSGRRRKIVKGAEDNMIRSFLQHARAQSALIANMEHGAQVNEAYIQAREQSKANPELTSVFNMITKHYQDSMNFKETPIQDRIAAGNTLYMLTTSIGYHVTNFTQAFMVALPKIAGQFGDYSKALNALQNGYKVGMKSGMVRADWKNKQVLIDPDKAPVKYQKLLKELQLLQLLDVGIENDISEFNRFDTGFEPINKISDVAGKWVHRLYQVSRWVEAQNRISSAVAAYDMALANPGKIKGMTAEEYAVSVVEDSQGNFSRIDAPLLLKTLPGAKIVGQYRKYQIMMGWMYATAFKQAAKGMTAEEKAVGRRTLAYALGHAGVFAGMTGLPIAGVITAFLALSGEGDEPEDLERWIRRNVKDEGMAELLSRGIFGYLGVDMSSKLSQANIFHPLPYTDFDMTEDGVKSIVYDAAMGPSGATVKNFLRAFEYAKQGDVYKTIEYATPKGIRNGMEAFRVATEGYTLRNGNVIADPRNFDWRIMFDAIGIPSSELRNIKWQRGQQFELEKYFDERSAMIRKDYLKAFREKDQGALKEARNEWMELQQEKDRVRPFFNDPKAIRRQPLSVLISYPSKVRRAERQQRRQAGN
jgi:hypothetical protein